VVEVAHHTEGCSLTVPSNRDKNPKPKYVDAGRFNGKSGYLPGEVSVKFWTWSREVSRGHSSKS